MAEQNELGTEIYVFESTEDKINKLNSFCNTGIDLIKAEKYQEALHHLGNRQLPESLEIDSGDSKSFFLHRDLDKPGDEEKVLDFVSAHSHFNHSHNLEIKLAGLSNVKLTNMNEKYFVPQNVWKNIALVHLEEWLHATQFISGKPLAGEKDEEFDVAIYMKGKGIKLTDHFLQMHGRSQFFREHPDL